MSSSTLPRREFPEVRTRGSFRREYEASLAPGSEAAALSTVSAELAATRVQLRALRARRVELGRRSAEHVRKLADWKGKVPRALGAAVPEGPGPVGFMPRVGIAEVRRRGELELGLVFLKRFVRGLEGVERFSKIWVLAVPGKGDGVVDGDNASTASGSGNGSRRCWGNDDFVMVLVDVVGRVGKGVRDKEVLVVRDGGGNALEKLVGATVIDIKPYLRYCEAHPDDSRDLLDDHGPDDTHALPDSATTPKE